MTGRGWRLLAVDIDGTLLRSDRTISDRTRSALAAAAASGVHVVLVTGRRYPAARALAGGLAEGGPIVLHNGALIVEDGRVLRCRPLPRPLAMRAVAAGLARGAEPVVHCGQRGEGRLLVRRTAAGANTLLTYYLERAAADVTVVADLDAALSEDPMQVMFAGGLADMEALRPPLARELGGAARVERTVYPRVATAILDVLDASAGKADALRFLQELWGVAPSETIAIGDNWNDHEMLQRAGLGLVMANADDALLALGLPVVPSNDEDGVAVAVENYVLARRPGG